MLVVTEDLFRGVLDLGKDVISTGTCSSLGMIVTVFMSLGVVGGEMV